MRDHIEFWRQFRSRFRTTGAVVPSSRFLAGAMTKPFRRRTYPARILEVGPGTGAITRVIVDHIRPGDHFDLVELNESFAEVLQRRFRTDPNFHDASSQSRVHVCSLEEFQPSGQYDFIISGLPLNNFSPELVRQVFDIYFELLGPRGVLSYFEYMYVRPVKMRVGPRDVRDRMRAVERIVSPYLDRHRIRQSWVFVNVPPAWVQHLQNDDALFEPQRTRVDQRVTV